MISIDGLRRICEACSILVAERSSGLQAVQECVDATIYEAGRQA